MNICARELIFETTRRCNGGKVYGGGQRHPCEHCLRGMPQNVVMSNDVISAIARNVDRASTLTFTGGEPTLVPRVIEEIFHQFRSKEYDSFYIVTNGVRYSPKTVAILSDEYHNNRYLDTEIAALSVSVDPFHEFNSDVYHKYRNLKFFRPDKEMDFRHSESILDEGLAAENGIGGRVEKPHLEIDTYNDGDIDIGLLYVNAHGDIIPGCNFSYETQERIKIGNILDESLEDIILRYIAEHGENDSEVSQEALDRYGSQRNSDEDAA